MSKELKEIKTVDVSNVSFTKEELAILQEGIGLIPVTITSPFLQKIVDLNNKIFKLRQ